MKIEEIYDEIRKDKIDAFSTVVFFLSFLFCIGVLFRWIIRLIENTTMTLP